LVSNFVGITAPGTIGTELTRIIGIQRAKVPLARVLLSIVLDRVIGAFALAVVVLFGLLLSPRLLRWEIVLAAVLVLTAVGVALGCASHGGLRRAGFRVLPAGIRERFEPKFRQVAESIELYRKHPWTLVLTLVYAVTAQVTRILTFAVLALALGFTVPIAYLAVIVPLVTFLAMLPITVIGIGVSEASYVYFLGVIGVTAENAFALSIANLLTYLVALLPGALLVAFPTRTTHGSAGGG
jgi:hypothetical protein